MSVVFTQSGPLSDIASKLREAISWLQAMLLDDRCSGRCGEEFDQPRGGVRHLRRTMNAARIYGDVLDLCRQRSKNLDALHGNPAD